MRYKLFFLLVAILLLSTFKNQAQSFMSDYQIVEAVNFKPIENPDNTTNYRLVHNKSMYEERWDTLPQPNFWRTLMTMDEDSALLNIGFNRQIIKKVAVEEWNKLQDERKNAIRDSIRNHYGLAPDARIFLTSGKNHFMIFIKYFLLLKKELMFLKPME